MSNHYPFFEPSAMEIQSNSRAMVDEHRVRDEVLRLDERDTVKLLAGKAAFVLEEDGRNVQWVEFSGLSPQDAARARDRAVPVVEHVFQNKFTRATPQQQREMVEDFRIEAQLSDAEVYKRALEQPKHRLGLPPTPLRPELFPANQPGPTLRGQFTGRTSTLILYVDAHNKEGTIDRRHIDPRSKENVDQLRLGDSICIDFKNGPRATLTIERAASQRTGLMHIDEMHTASAPRAGGMRR